MIETIQLKNKSKFVTKSKIYKDLVNNFACGATWCPKRGLEHSIVS